MEGDIVEGTPKIIRKRKRSIGKEEVIISVIIKFLFFVCSFFGSIAV